MTEAQTTTGAAAASPASARRGLTTGTWLATALLIVTIMSLLVSVLVTMRQVSRLGDDLISERARALLSVQGDEIERYLRSQQRFAATLASNLTVRDAARRFANAYARVGSEMDPAAVAATTDDLTAYYDTELVPGLEAVANREVRAAELLPVSDSGRYLQRRYTIGATDAELAGSADGSAWSAVHDELHGTLTTLADRVGFEDLMLVEPDANTVVYSVAKRPEFATSLDVGPYSGSVLAAGIRAVGDQGGAGTTQMTDLAPYGPDAGRPAAFVIAPIIDGDDLLYLLVGKLSTDEIDRIMTVGGRWEDAGFGATTETFLVGADGRMRSISRAFVEDPDAYLDAVARSGTANAANRRAIASTQTTASFQRVFTDSELEALPATPIPVDRSGYLGRGDVTAVQALDLPGVEWAVAIETSRAQLDAPLVAYRRATLVAVALAAVVIALLAVAWTRRVFRPLRAVSERLQQIHDGRPTRPVTVSDRAPREFAELAESVEHMIVALDRRRAAVAAVVAERRDTLRALLPATVAERIDAGDRRVVDQIPQASVAVVTIGGLGDMVGDGGDAAAGRAALDSVVGALELLAERYGLVRVKLLGDSLFAGCGLERPYLDHALRTVNFARAAQQEARRLTADDVRPVGLSVGIDSGPVTVGLTGSLLLVFEMWGDTVTAAHSLAQQAARGETLITERTRALLPPDVAVTPRVGPAGEAWHLDEVAGKEATP